MRRDHQGGWRVTVTGVTAGLAFAFLPATVYGENLPPHDADGLRQTIRSLQDRIERLESAQSLREVEQEHEELRPRSGDRLTFLQEGATLPKVVAGPYAMVGVVATRRNSLGYVPASLVRDTPDVKILFVLPSP